MSTSKDLKYTGVTTAGAWATGGNLSTARLLLGGAGTQTAALAFGGYPILQEQQKNMTDQLGHQIERLDTARDVVGGAGTQTAALGFGGIPAVTGRNRRI
jgi:hypothetical protein